MSDSLEGFLLVDKCEGPSSFGIVHQLRKLTKVKRIGHAGTLDPFASGLLILALGRSYTRQISRFQKQDKVYEMTIRLGTSTPSLDPETPIDKQTDRPIYNDAQLLSICQQFIGDITQVPPVYSAKHINGKRSYALAREGKAVEPDPINVRIDSIELGHIARDENAAIDTLDLRVRCATGCYMRSLARDIAIALGTLGYCSTLRRVQSGTFKAADALPSQTMDLDVISAALFTSYR
ncbi:MAG: tRNA pseudouridine(55) synthase TruB [bacterium]